MARPGLWLRAFIALLIAVLPPLLLVIGTVVLADALLAGRDAEVVAAIVVGGSVLWAALLAIFYARAIADDVRSLLSVAERGERRNEIEIGDPHGQLAASLAERNRQVAALVTETGRVPIDDTPIAVVDAVLSAVRSVTGDATWRCAVLESENPALLPAGTYHGTDDARPSEPLGDLERWAAVSTGEVPARIEGPWGAFLAIDVGASDRLRSVLYAPWEGRPQPTPAEIDLLTLVGQHAGTAIEHSLLYAQVRTQADELNRLAAVQSDFLRGVTHDLQTPLTSISALATELRADDSLAHATRADLESISYQAERLRRMVSQLLVASRLEAGVLTPQQEVFAVAPLVERTWAALRADRPFELVVTGAPHLAVADSDRFEQVLWAIMDNAVKYSPPGSPITVHVRPDRPGELLVTISDAGAGMDAETVKRAFDQFFRSTQARRLAPDGSGVGLYAANGLMRAMGGSIEIDSHLGTGTTVTLHVPAEVVDEASA